MTTEDEEPDKIFVGALAWNTNEESLEQYFGKYGEVEETHVMMDKITLRSRGFGFVRFRDPACIQQVLKERPHYLDGRQIDPKPCTPKSIQMQKRTAAIEHVQTHKIFVGGIARDATEDDVQKYFEKFGEVAEVVFVMDNDEGRHKGFGFVTFERASSVDEVVNIHFHDIKGRKVETKRAQPRDKMLTGTVRPPHKDPQYQPNSRQNGNGYGHHMPHGMSQGPSGGWMPNSGGGMSMGYGYGYGPDYGQQQSYYGYNYPQYGNQGGYGGLGPEMNNYAQSQSYYGPSKGGPSYGSNVYGGDSKRSGAGQGYHPYRR